MCLRKLLVGNLLDVRNLLDVGNLLDVTGWEETSGVQPEALNSPRQPSGPMLSLSIGSTQSLRPASLRAEVTGMPIARRNGSVDSVFSRVAIAW